MRLTDDQVRTIKQTTAEVFGPEVDVRLFGSRLDDAARGGHRPAGGSIAESTGSQIENLNRAERPGVIASTEEWLAARKLRHQLVHEYMQDAAAFAEALDRARHHSLVLMETYNRVRRFAEERMTLETTLPPLLTLPDAR